LTLPGEAFLKPVALISGPFIHHVDHLAPLGDLLGFPLIVDDETTYEIAKYYYPNLKIELLNLDLKSLANTFNFFILSTKYASRELKNSFELLGIEDIECCFCPHGQSDKGLSNSEMCSFEGQETALFYGDLQKKRYEGKVKKSVVVGNYRLHYFEKYRSFFNSLIKNEVFSLFEKKQPTILYAPTWNDQEYATTFFTAFDELINNLSPNYNLIVKLHPLLEKQHPAHAARALSFHLSKPNLQVLIDIPLIYPLLSQIDLYVGDYSAIGYDFLYFNRPMFFLGDKQVPLTTCGEILPSPKFLFSKPTIDQSHLSKERLNLYQEAFSPFQSNVFLNANWDKGC
jgi:hypothetical protein